MRKTRRLEIIHAAIETAIQLDLQSLGSQLHTARKLVERKMEEKTGIVCTASELTEDRDMVIEYSDWQSEHPIYILTIKENGRIENEICVEVV